MEARPPLPRAVPPSPAESAASPRSAISAEPSVEQSPARASFSASSAGSESANARRPKPGEAVLDVATSSDPRAVAALRQQVAELQSRLRASEAKVAMWEECMQNMCHCVLLSPDMNDMYKDYCSDLLREALGTVEQISSVRFVDCSFPSVPSEAPHIQLERWESMQDSEWQLRWAPSWSVQVAVEGSHYLQFTLMLRLFDFRVSGRIKMRMSQDMSTVSMSFLKMPKLRLRTSCAVSWGSVPLPLQTYIETVVQDEFQRWMRENAVLPNELQMHPQSFQPKHGLTDEDVERARRAVTLAKEVSALTETS